MFGPNTHFDAKISINHSHRHEQFNKYYTELSIVFKELFSLQDYDLLFVSGSGTVGVTAMFWSALFNINMIGHSGVFTNRWKLLAQEHFKPNFTQIEEMYCQLETSGSHIYHKENSIVDAISSFPYYNIPKNTKIFITCSNKQLGSFSGLSIIGVRKDFWRYLKPATEFSYLNLALYKEFDNIGQTPFTAPTHIFQHLLSKLEKFNLQKLKDKIVTNSVEIVQTIGYDNIIGNSVCPVITIPKKVIPKQLATKWKLYGYNKVTNNYQIFTYSCPDNQYNSFLKELRNAYNTYNRK